ncbi:hypothetical protein RFI_20844 [Reticulomyxa filosa]|uniref:Uncharacterized protein n=1 Tax=Reticulomyxa filosa TaxID=46433 RepID=X6MRR3_RETFI|nr:hypothetical protein RFI_20844 [Reticulomyxa filosa]|eukprot:ETO16494.1 hypothetical protein RFI_20844 [Reticulomyxa filosa]
MVDSSYGANMFLFGIAHTLVSAVFYTEHYLSDRKYCAVNFRFLLIIVQRTALHGYFIGRLHSVFEGSVYAFSQSGLWYYYFKIDTCIGAHDSIISMIVPYFWDALYSIVLSALFVSKLKAVNNSIMDENSEDNGGSLKIQKTAAKFTILTTVGVLSSLSFIFLYIVIGVIAAVSDLLVNIFLLILTFKPYDQWYNYCCYGCRRCCEVRPKSNAKNLIIKS